MLVSTARLQINGTTYALRNLTSVRMAEQPPSYGGPVAMILFGCLLAMIGSFSGLGRGDWTLLWWGLPLLVLGVIVAFVLKAEYSVVVLSTAGERPALVSRDRAHIERIVGAINEAIVRRH